MNIRRCSSYEPTAHLFHYLELITDEQLEKHSHLRLVGLVGSRDTDMYMTDLIIGAPTARQRICESLDNINSTAYSHSRAFVVEVMGRDCGWLALMAGIAYVTGLVRDFRSDLEICLGIVVALTLSSSPRGRQQPMSGRIICATRSNEYVSDFSLILCFPISSLFHSTGKLANARLSLSWQKAHKTKIS